MAREKRAQMGAGVLACRVLEVSNRRLFIEAAVALGNVAQAAEVCG
jgi:hypothetical protein